MKDGFGARLPAHPLVPLSASRATAMNVETGDPDRAPRSHCALVADYGVAGTTCTPVFLYASKANFGLIAAVWQSLHIASDLGIAMKSFL